MSLPFSVELATMRNTETTLRASSSDQAQMLYTLQHAVSSLLSSNQLGRAGSQLSEHCERATARMQQQIVALELLAARLGRFADRVEELDAQLESSAGVVNAPGNVPSDSGALPGGGGNGEATLEPTAPPTANEPVSTAFKPLPAGTTTAPNVLPNLAGCTHYVASRFNLNDWGRWPNAEGWDNAARAAGYPVGTTPAADTIMVFEPGVLGAHNTAGHVAYVEQVTQDGDHFRVRISEANVAYASNGAVLWGTHTPPTQREIALRLGSDGVLYDQHGQALSGVSFIYGR